MAIMLQNKARFHGKLTVTADILSWIIIAVAGAVLIGWHMNIEFLKRLAPGLIAMNPVTAVCLISASLTLLLYDSHNLNKKIGDFPLLLIGVIALCGTLKILELALDWHTDFDAWLFPVKLQNEALKYKANRMAPNTALCFILSALSLLLLTTRKALFLRQVLAMFVFFIGLLAVLGYLFEVKQLYGVLSFIPMAMHTGICFMILATALFFKEPSEGLMREFTSCYSGGVMERRLFPAAIMMPTLLGYVVFLGYRKNVYGLEFGFAILILGVILIFFSLIRFTAMLLNNRDALHAYAENTLKKSNERFFKIFNLSTEAKSIVIIETGRLMLVNEAFQKLCGLPNLDVAGKTFEELNLWTAVDRKNLAVFLSEIESAKNLDFKIKTADGKEKDLMVNRDVMELDGIPCFLFKFFDITERKINEEEIQVLNSVLEHNVMQLESTNRDLESFSYSVSHDLRAPLRRIIQFSEMLNDDPDPDDAKLFSEKIVEQAYAMNVLIEDLLSFANLGNQKVQKKLLDTRAMVEKVVEDVKFGSSSNAVVTIKNLLPMYGDETLMRQVFINLISNAVKYSGTEKVPQIEIGSLEDDHEHVYYVKDNGAGFDMKFVHKLFVVFQRLHSPSDFKGTGVGLALVQKIVSKHGGRAWAIGETGKGATFSFSVPNQIVANSIS